MHVRVYRVDDDGIAADIVKQYVGVGARLRVKKLNGGHVAKPLSVFGQHVGHVVCGQVTLLHHASHHGKKSFVQRFAGG